MLLLTVLFLSVVLFAVLSVKFCAITYCNDLCSCCAGFGIMTARFGCSYGRSNRFSSAVNCESSISSMSLVRELSCSAEKPGILNIMVLNGLVKGST